MRRVSALGVLLAAVLGFSLYVAAPAEAAQFFLRPDRGPAGSTFTVVGAGYLPSEAVRVTWDGKPLAIHEADVNGNIETSATVPADATLGGHEVRAEGGSSGLGQSRIFTVTKTQAQEVSAPSPVAAPAQAPPAAPAAPAAVAAAAPAAAAPPATEAQPAPLTGSGFTPITLVEIPPDSATAEVAFDVRVPLPGIGGPKEAPEALLLLAFSLLAVMGVRTLHLGRRLHVW